MCSMVHSGPMADLRAPILWKSSWPDCPRALHQQQPLHLLTSPFHVKMAPKRKRFATTQLRKSVRNRNVSLGEEGNVPEALPKRRRKNSDLQSGHSHNLEVVAAEGRHESVVAQPGSGPGGDRTSSRRSPRLRKVAEGGFALEHVVDLSARRRTGEDKNTVAISRMSTVPLEKVAPVVLKTAGASRESEPSRASRESYVPKSRYTTGSRKPVVADESSSANQENIVAIGERSNTPPRSTERVLARSTVGFVKLDSLHSRPSPKLVATSGVETRSAAALRKSVDVGTNAEELHPMSGEGSTESAPVVDEQRPTSTQFCERSGSARNSGNTGGTDVDVSLSRRYPKRMTQGRGGLIDLSMSEESDIPNGSEDGDDEVYSCSDEEDRILQESEPPEVESLEVANPTIVTNEHSKERTRYKYVKRVRGDTQKESDLVQRRRSIAAEAENVNFSDWSCCKKQKCFHNVDVTFFRAQRAHLLKASQPERKQALLEMLREDGYFYFNHRKVCTLFLARGLGYSKDIQRSVKGTPKAPATPLAQRTPKMEFKSDVRDIILAFLRTLASSTAEQMPDNDEKHLPFHQKKHVYDMFRQSLQAEPVLGIPREPPSFSYFIRMWNEHMGTVKVRAVKRFTKCAECESIRSALVRAARDKSATEGIMELRRRHLSFVQRERASYVARAQRAVSDPEKVCSIVIDGADQSNFGLPHFAVNTKETRGEALKVKLVGLLEHGSRNSLFLFTLTAQFETGANHVIECLHRWLQKKASLGGLATTLYIQMDNSSRENKNRFTFAYLECLVSWGIFEEVLASFLPIGHTHSDIDQTFSCTSRRLRVNDAITLTEMQDQLRKSYTPTPSVYTLNHVANFSKLIQSERCVEEIPPFTQYRFFKFCRRRGMARKGTGRYRTSCFVKVSCDGEWQNLAGNRQCGFLKFAPDLSRTPKNVLTSPDNAIKVTERIDSEEGRINDEKKVAELRALRDDVYRCREDPFHWDLENCVERKAASGQNFQSSATDDPENPQTYIPITKVSYELNSFVVVKPKNRTRECPFWIAQVMEQHRNEQGDVSSIKVRWYEVTGNGNVYDGKYTPSFRDDSNGMSVGWFGDVCTDAVMFSFPSLTYHGFIGRLTVRRIQAALQSH